MVLLWLRVIGINVEEKIIPAAEIFRIDNVRNSGSVTWT